jgi:ABC-type Fe3+/spermidine/putrescine transport system ATPase subunit
VVEVDGLDAGYNGNPVVRDLTLHVGEAEVVALLGANGAGKTTTLATIAGLQRPLAGRIRMNGQDIAGKSAHRLARGGLSLVPEGRALFASLTTRENLRLGAGPGRSHDEVLDLLPELRKCLDRKAGLLSGRAPSRCGSGPRWPTSGGIPFTPVESNYPNAVIFDDVSVADNAAASVYAAKTLHAKTAAIIYTSDTQGTSVADNVLVPVMKNAGYTKVTKVPVPPTATDVTSAVAAAIGGHPDVVYIDDPNSCPQVLSSLKQLGSTAKVLGVDPCTSPAAIAAANGGATGMYYSSPVVAPDAGTTQSNLYVSVLKKYAPKNIPLDSLTAMGFATVMNVQAALAHFSTAQLTTAKILAAFRGGSAHPNFMAHPYTCDGKQLAGATAVCNAYQQIRQVQGIKIVVADPNWVTAGAYYKG